MSNSYRAEYALVVKSVEAAGFCVTDVPLDDGGDRIVCAGLKREGGGYTGSSFWLAERGGNWFLGAWPGVLYRIRDAKAAAELSVTLLNNDRETIVLEIDGDLRDQFGVVEATGSEFVSR